MIELGIARPARLPEQRSYSGALLDAAYAVAAATGQPRSSTLACVQACAGAWGWALTQATIDPPLIPPALLGEMGYVLGTEGQYIGLLDVRPDGSIAVHPTVEANITGGYDPLAWQYALTLPGPSRTTTLTAGAERVVHPRLRPSGAEPWRGRSPIAAAAESGRLAANLERSTADESRHPTGSLVTVPVGTATQTDEDGNTSVTPLAASLQKLRGRLGLVETTEDGAGDPAVRPQRDWRPERIGPSFTAAGVSLRGDVAAEIAGLYGVHPMLLWGNGDGTAMRESLRRFQRVTVEPLARVIAGELERVLERPLAVTFERLRASDVAGAARAYRTLRGKEGGLEDTEARDLSGIGT